MNIQGFNLNELKRIADSSEFRDKAYNCLKYIDDNIFILDNGDYLVLRQDKDSGYEIYNKDTLNSTYLNRAKQFFDINLIKYFYETKIDVKNIVVEINKPFLYDNKINLSPPLKWTYNKEYKNIDENIKNKVNIFLNYLKEVICSNNEEQYNFLLKWLSNMVRGNRNDSCLYLRGEEGIGKSTFTRFIIDYVIGRGLSLCCGSEPFGSYNESLRGKLFVSFEELPNMGITQWNFISSILKMYITEPTIMIKEKYKNSMELKNIGNFVVNSNFDVIDSGRRYFELDVSHDKYKNTDYFGTIKNNCYNDEVGEAFFIYLYEIDLTGYYAQNYPISKNKLRSISKRLCSVYKFIKDEYILKNNKFIIKYKDVYEHYKYYCSNNSLKALSQQDFKYKLEIVGIKTYMSGGFMKYKVDIDTLKEIAEKYNWIYETDEEENKDNNNDDEYEELNKEIENYKKIIKEKDEENERLKKEIEELKKNNIKEEIIEETKEEIIEEIKEEEYYEETEEEYLTEYLEEINIELDKLKGENMTLETRKFNSFIHDNIDKSTDEYKEDLMKEIRRLANLKKDIIDRLNELHKPLQKANNIGELVNIFLNQREYNIRKEENKNTDPDLNCIDLLPDIVF